MAVVQAGDRYFGISEKIMQVIESVDSLYEYLKKENLPLPVHKPTLIRKLLDKLDGNYDEYLRMSESDKEQYLKLLFLACIAGG